MMPKYKVTMALFIITLGIAIILAMISNITRQEFVAKEAKTLAIYKGESLFKIDIGGIIKVSGEIPEGIKLYFLSYTEYLNFIKRGTLPNNYLDSIKGETTVRNPYYILANSTLDNRVLVNLKFEIYKEEKPYALLSLISYGLTILALVLIFILLEEKLIKKVNLF